MSWKKIWIAKSLILMCCVSCTKTVIRPMSERLLTPRDAHCSCMTISEEELGHLMLIGDKRLQRLLDDHEWCIEKGFLEEPMP